MGAGDELHPDGGRFGPHDGCKNLIERLAAQIAVSVPRNTGEMMATDSKLPKSRKDSLQVFLDLKVNSIKNLS